MQRTCISSANPVLIVSLNFLPCKVINRGYICCHYSRIFDKYNYISQSIDHRLLYNLYIYYQASNQHPLDWSYNDYNNLDSNVYKLDLLYIVLGI
jgi:hypothetical protein